MKYYRSLWMSNIVLTIVEGNWHKRVFPSYRTCNKLDILEGKQFQEFYLEKYKEVSLKTMKKMSKLLSVDRDFINLLEVV